MKDKAKLFFEKIKNIAIPPKGTKEKYLEKIVDDYLNEDDSNKKNLTIHTLLLLNTRLYRLMIGVVGSAGIVISICLVVTFASMSSVKKVPLLYLVKDNGQMLYLGESVKTMSDQELQQRMPEYFLGEFVKNAFTVSSDGAVQKQKKNKAFAMTRGKASEWLRSYYDRNDPYKTAKKDTVTVEINYVYPNPNISNFYTVGWTTTEMEAKTGEIVKIQKYVGEFHFEWGTHKDESVINNYNPMGFFIEDVSVSKDNSKKVFNN